MFFHPPSWAYLGWPIEKERLLLGLRRVSWRPIFFGYRVAVWDPSRIPRIKYIQGVFRLLDRKIVKKKHSKLGFPLMLMAFTRKNGDFLWLPL